MRKGIKKQHMGKKNIFFYYYSFMIRWFSILAEESNVYTAHRAGLEGRVRPLFFLHIFGCLNSMHRRDGY